MKLEDHASGFVNELLPAMLAVAWHLAVTVAAVCVVSASLAVSLVSVLYVFSRL